MYPPPRVGTVGAGPGPDPVPVASVGSRPLSEPRLFSRWTRAAPDCRASREGGLLASGGPSPGWLTVGGRQCSALCHGSPLTSPQVLLSPGSKEVEAQASRTGVPAPSTCL